MDGRKSFNFSWDKEHGKIHEEAILNFFNPSKKGQKFEPQPPERRAPTKSVTQPQPRASGTSRKKTEGMKAQQPPDTWNPSQCDHDRPLKERNTESSYPSASYVQLAEESPPLCPAKADRSSQDTASLTTTTSLPHFKINERKGKVRFFCCTSTSGE